MDDSNQIRSAKGNWADGGLDIATRRKGRGRRPSDLLLCVINEENEVERSPLTQPAEKQCVKVTYGSKPGPFALIRQLPLSYKSCDKSILSPIPENQEYKKRQKLPIASKFHGEIGKQIGRMDTPTSQAVTFCFWALLIRVLQRYICRANDHIARAIGGAKGRIYEWCCNVTTKWCMW